MNPERWSQIQALFEAALEQEPPKRITFLKAACENDLELYREVSSLLESDQQINSLIDGRALDAVTLSREKEAQDALADPEVVGPYRIVRRIGQGGMGIVYLAERIEGAFEQRVALKLIKRGMDTESIIRRFMSERQILARLQHPHIARLLDGGSTEDGRPYFAMEYIEGIPLLQYCNVKGLDIDARLGLFEDVCRAVQYAHRNLIVHRDLKPGNILVTRDQQVKLLDFGIARMLQEDDATPQTLLTEAGMRVLTPEYAAPEQVSGKSITTQTDVYSLGVVLYELLCGVRPLKLTSHTPKEVEAVICEKMPAKPSSRLAENEKTEESYATSPEKLIRRLEGDLDVICLKALQKEPERRFSSVDEFWQDIARHLSGLPVNAQSDSTLYRLRKFISRHKNGVFMAAASALLLLTVISVYTWRISKERDRAQLAATEAEQVTTFLTELLSAANPHVAQGDTLNVRQVLDQGSIRIRNELTDQPDVQASLLSTIGDAYNGLGLYERAESHFNQALSILRSTGRGETPEAALLLQNMADIRHSLSDFVVADSLERLTLALQKHLHGEEHPAIAEILLKMASTNRSLGKYDVAIPLYHEAVAMNEKLLPKDDPELAWSINNLGWAYHSSGQYDEAESAYRKAVSIQREFLGDDHPDLAFTLNNLGGLLRTTGRSQEGEPLIRESLAIRTNLYGEEHPETMQTLNNLAGLLFQRGQYEEAGGYYERLYAFNVENLGPRHRYTAITMGSIASVSRERGDLERAETFQRQSLDLMSELFGENHRLVANAKSNMGTIYRLVGQKEQAIKMYEGSLAYWRAQDTPAIEMAFPLLGLGTTLLEDNPDAAEPLIREAVAMRTERLAADDLRLAEALGALGRCLIVQGRVEEGRRQIQEALDMFTGAGKIDDRRAVEMREWTKGT